MDKRLKLNLTLGDDKSFDMENTIKKDAFSMPSRFLASTVFYSKTKEESQTYATTIIATAFLGKEKIGEINMADEFDSSRDAKKWIEKVYKDFLDIIK